jgi:uncharacterized delta-60 repeat protein
MLSSLNHLEEKMKKTGSPFYKSILVAVCFALLIYTVALAASGDLDTTFSGDGKIIQSFGGTQHRGMDVAVQADGKVVVVGEKWTAAGRDFAIARYNPNGSLDATFSGDGRQVINIGVTDQAVGVAIQTDGKIVVGGQTCNSDSSICDVAIVRLNPNGTLDASFSGDGKVITDFGSGDNGGFDLTMQGTKIVVAGYSHDGTSYNATVYRYLSNGSLDTTFSGDGILPINFGAEDFFNAVAYYSGKIYVTGHGDTPDYSAGDFITARINTNGTLDTTFSGDGKVKTSLGTQDLGLGLAINNGKVVVVGKSDDNIAIVQYTASGALDPTFSGDGKLRTNLGFSSPSLNGVTIQAGKIVASGGTGEDALLVRYTAAGNLDTTFSADGIVTADWGGVNDWYRSVIFKNARFYVVGSSKTASDVLRFIIAAYKP